ncbi:cobalt ABC transporter permease [Nostocoides sp. F2B08]|uniref:PDGLE domain-containing protein n=1 Tax=Nostocoides sp. F2B08 TaxID=2653936 RepID=UPI001262E313|nr:PDGLE domain-containing protein [Tetrasphaera sp. F2B08]KAB7743242.1 cobalt ABC transporter permease [Tetrasphaera sp. F2B08]
MSTQTDQRSTTPAHRVRTRTLVVAGLLVSLALAAVVSLFASASPDGLEHVAETLGFAETAADSAVAESPLADYGTAGVGNEWLSTAIAGVVGLLVTGLVAFGLMRLLARPSGRD